MEDETKDIGAGETTLLDGASDDATTLLDDAADDATTLLDDAADDATTLLGGASAQEATTLLGTAPDAATAPDETGLFVETDVLDGDLPEDVTDEGYSEESDDEYDRRMMITAILGAVVFVLAIVGGLALSGAGSRLFHLFFMPAPIEEAPDTLLAPESPAQPATSARPSSTPAAPVNAGANAADVSDVTPRNHGTSDEEAQVEEPIEELEPEPEPEPIEEPVEEKVWVDEQGHYEDIYETQLVEVGQEWVVDVPSEPIYEVVDGEEVVTGYTEEQGHYEPIYEEQQVVVGQEWVIDVPGHWE